MEQPWASASPGGNSPLCVPKDEYLADLYHFATKEDSYANYFIHVSPRPGPGRQSWGVGGGQGTCRWNH